MLGSSVFRQKESSRENTRFALTKNWFYQLLYKPTRTRQTKTNNLKQSVFDGEAINVKFRK